ncbi:MAG: class I SAM-dependent methyltransferase [Magnetococcales bacterium]|nr:class I SAM-dependent methyltransferase [Magnetococcales bacterium]
MTDQPRFAFGQNWREFSTTLNDAALQDARRHVAALLESCSPAHRDSFLDVGCGSGLFLLAARDHFARVTGFDYDPVCVETSRDNVGRFSAGEGEVTLLRGDALDATFQEGLGRFDCVYAWGSLHHTGEMWKAVRLTAGRVAPGGVLVLALYNRHWSSPLWWYIKRLYVASPGWLRRVLTGLTALAAIVAKGIHTRSNPLKQRRGMGFYHNMVDWVGGYPYEYASVREVVDFVEPLGFESVGVRPGDTPIACNEFVFRRG